MADFLFWLESAHALDLHLAPGLSSGRLDQRVWASIGGAVERGDRLPLPYSLAILVPDQEDPALWQGVQVEPDVGRVGVPGPLPEPPDDRVLRMDVGLQLHHAQLGDVADPLFLTVWIHERLEQVWLSPRVLTLHTMAARPSRFSLMARFEESFTADVSSWVQGPAPVPGDEDFVHLVDETLPLLAWSATGVALEGGTGKLAAVAAGQGSVTVSVRQQGIADAVATVSCVGPWATATLVDFVGGAGQGVTDRVSNILFLPDGFLAEDEELFRTLVDLVVRSLSSEPMLQPLPLLVDRVNHWLAWVPSRQRGTSVASNGLLDPGGHFVRQLDAPPVTQPGAVFGQVVLDQTSSRLLNDNDTTFHLVQGERRRAQPGAAQRVTVINPDRLGADDFDAFLGALTCAEVPEIGHRWATGGPDEVNVVVVGLSPFHGGTNSIRREGSRVAALTTGVADLAPVRTTAEGLDLALDVVPAVASQLDLATLVAHELGHSWGLGDEYTELGWPGSTTGWVNLITEAEVTDPGSGRWDGARVRWTWPRLRGAAELVAAPEASEQPLDADDPSWQLGRRVLVTVRPEEATPFAVADLVRVRTRPLVGSVTSAQHRVTAVVRRAQDDAVELEPVTGDSDLLGPGSLNPFTAGSLLILPQLQDEPGPVVEEASMMHPAVRQHLTDHSNPLNAEPAAGDARACLPTQERQAPVSATNLPPGLVMPPGVLSWHLVGLFEGGGRASCGVFHPAGSCMMNARLGVDAVGGVAATPFCAVCRYALVDLLAPTLHPEVDELYDAIYPTYGMGGTP